MANVPPNVPPLESAGVDACLHDYSVRDALRNHRDDEKMVRDALHNYGIDVGDVTWKKVYAQIKKIDWTELNKLENELGRGVDMG